MVMRSKWQANTGMGGRIHRNTQLMKIDALFVSGYARSNKNPAFAGFLLKLVIIASPAVSYSPTQLPMQYHWR
jgi:hypothetical protein